MKSQLFLFFAFQIMMISIEILNKNHSGKNLYEKKKMFKLAPKTRTTPFFSGEKK